MRVFTIFALIVHRIGFMAIIFLQPEKNSYKPAHGSDNLLSLKIGFSEDQKSKYLRKRGGGGCNLTFYIGLGDNNRKDLKIH